MPADSGIPPGCFSDAAGPERLHSSFGIEVMFTMITQDQVRELVYERINRPDPYWPDRPEMIVVRVDHHELGWLVFYDSRPHHETGDIRFAIAGNAPYLVSRHDGTMFATGTAPPLEERVREAERKLKTHLETTK